MNVPTYVRTDVRTDVHTASRHCAVLNFVETARKLVQTCSAELILFEDDMDEQYRVVSERSDLRRSTAALTTAIEMEENPFLAQYQPRYCGTRWSTEGELREA